MVSPCCGTREWQWVSSLRLKNFNGTMEWGFCGGCKALAVEPVCIDEETGTASFAGWDLEKISMAR